MIKVIIKVVLLVFGNFILLKTFFASGNYFGLIVIFYFLYAIITLPFDIAELFTKLKIGYSKLTSENIKKDRAIKKHAEIGTVAMIGIIVLQALIIYSFINYNGEKLSSEGKYAFVVVKETKWKYHGHKKRHYIFYDFFVNGKKYSHQKENNLFVVGDSVKILYHPDNPNNHKIVSDITKTHHSFE